VADRSALQASFERHRPDRVIHLAAQAGVRYSITNPEAYGESNLTGFLNVLEACRRWPVAHLVYASSSSVYGGNRKLPFHERDSVDHPVSLYAATKKANELMAHTYSHLYRLPTTGLRFFTVYGPWGRPDMAYYSFTRDILAGRPIQVYNQGRMRRDFTYIDDIVSGVVAVLDKAAEPLAEFDARQPVADRSDAPYRVFNIGNAQSVMLGDFITGLEQALGVSALRIPMGMQPGDVVETEADVSALAEWVGVRPGTQLAAGLAEFAAWYRAHHGAEASH
jgi:UDP-glucuronate 4-epimerase